MPTSMRHGPDVLTGRARHAMSRVLAGGRLGWRGALPFIGPAVVASVAYIDPGNIATNIEAGARHGLGLLWAALLANLIAMLLQAMSARLGIVSGRNLAELSRQHFPRWRIGMWLASELAAMATDLAEFLGGAIGLSLLFHLPLLAGMLVTAVVSYAILLLGNRGFRPFELVIAGLLAAIGLCYLLEVLLLAPQWERFARQALTPHWEAGGALMLAVGIVGATVMPHAIYLHSGLTQARLAPLGEGETRRLIRYSNREVAGVLGLTGLVNLAMIVVAAAAFHDGVHNGVTEIETAYATLTPLLGGASAVIFLFALMASGISSSAIGTLAGQIVMQGFVDFRIPVWLRRLITMLPAFAVVALGFNTTQALIVSQVVLSVVLPLPMICLIALSRRRDVMGVFASSRLETAAATLATLLIMGLNALLLLQVCGFGRPLG